MRPKVSFRDRVSTALREEVIAFQPRLWVALAVGRVLPPFVGSRMRTALLRFAGVRIGRGTFVTGRLSIGGSRNDAKRLTIGDDSFINDGVRFDTTASITIGHRVALGHDVTILTSSHGIGEHGRRAGVSEPRPVRIGDGAWLGARALVMPGVEIADGAIVGAGAVVTKSVPSDTVVAGVPARTIRRLDVTDDGEL